MLVQGGRITAILPGGATPAALRVELPQRSILAPGLIDIQVNGGGGVFFNDAPDPSGIAGIAAAHLALGTSFILPTLITDRDTRMQQAVDAAAASLGQVPSLLGLHLEGPWLGGQKPGVHPAALIRAPDAAAIAWAGASAARLADAAAAAGAYGRLLITLAPETVAPAQIAALRAAQVIIACGHSAADAATTMAALQAGATGFTHIFNAMAPLSGRAGGIAAVALADRSSYCGVIADLHHVEPAMLRLLRACRPPSHIVLVSDAMACAGTDMTALSIGGRRVLRAQGRLMTEDGVLAGADLSLLEAVRRAIGTLAKDAAEALVMATAAPAAFLGLGASHGVIAPGAVDALTLLDEDLALLGVFGLGQWRTGGVPA